ncbi:MAG: ATP-binding protein [Nitrospirota bacterium]
MPSETAICLYRIAQEGLHNIAKHAKTNKASVSLWCEGRVVVLSIQDFGVGFDSASVRSSQGLGLASMRERAWLALGDIVIRSQPGEGTVIEVRVPFGEQQS